MKKLLGRLGTSAEHLRLIDDFFLASDPEYATIDKKLESIQGFNEMCEQVYYGHDGRQMILSDLLQHVLTIRGYHFFFQNRHAYLKILFYIVNQLMLQENMIRNQPERKKLLDFLEKNSNKLPGFFDGYDSEWRDKYDECKTAPEEDVNGARKRLYRVIDSVLPKSMGNATELLAFAYLLSNEIGHVMPLLEVQQHLKLTTNNVKVVPPDFLVIKVHKIFGVEVGAGPGGRGKISQSDIFMGKTGVPVITINVNPPGNNASYRCPTCEKWILYCDKIVDEYSKRRIRDVNSQGVDCHSCPNFSTCDKIMYYGREATGEKVYHYHYNCVRGLEYVKKTVEADPSKISPLYLEVEGLETLEE